MKLHSGGIAFDEYPTQQWISGFYKCCKILSDFQGESLNSLFGEDIQKEADLILAEVAEEILGKTKIQIAAYNKVFEGKERKDRIRLKEEAQNSSDKLAFKGHHKVICPSCDVQLLLWGNHSVKIILSTRMAKFSFDNQYFRLNLVVSACDRPS